MCGCPSMTVPQTLFPQHGGACVDNVFDRAYKDVTPMGALGPSGEKVAPSPEERAGASMAAFAAAASVRR